MDKQSPTFYRVHLFNIIFTGVLIFALIFTTVFFRYSGKGIISATPIMFLIPAFLISVCQYFQGMDDYRPNLIINTFIGSMVYVVIWIIDIKEWRQGLWDFNTLEGTVAIFMDIATVGVFPLVTFIILRFHTRIDAIEKGSNLSLNAIPSMYLVFWVVKINLYSGDNVIRPYLPTQILIVVGFWFSTWIIATISRTLLISIEYKK